MSLRNVHCKSQQQAAGDDFEWVHTSLSYLLSPGLWNTTIGNEFLRSIVIIIIEEMVCFSLPGASNLNGEGVRYYLPLLVLHK